MKKLNIFSLLILLHIGLFAQEEEYYPPNEFTIQIQNAENRTIVFELIPIGADWTKDSNCDLYLYNNDTTYISSLDGGSLGYVDCSDNGFSYRTYGENNNTWISGCAQTTAGLKPLRNGFYRLNIKENNTLKAYAYFDWRDFGFTRGCGNDCTGNDLTIRYDADEEEVMFWNSANIKYNNYSPDMTLFNGQVVYWSDWKCAERIFTPFWSEGLVLISPGGYPRIIWGPYTDDNYSTQGYYVYRAVNSSSTPPALNQFTLVETLNSSTYEWTDYDYSIGGPLKAHYYVKAVLIPTEGGGSTFSSPTNVTTTSVGVYKESKNNYKPAELFLLGQNYPNPFNPSTKISYSIKQDGFVTLKVYDILGVEIATLVNEQKTAGSYEADFNAANLPSGMYIYKLQSGSFTDVKKMLLTK
jgi:hypothetical protein